MRWLFPLFFLSALAWPAFAATIEMVPLNAPDTGLISVTGSLLPGDQVSFRTKATGLRKAIVTFNSDGGNLLAGIEIGKLIRLRGFLTVVPDGSLCASACATAWLGGRPRYMGPHARIGFHAAYQKDSGQVTGPGNALVGAYLSEIGLSYPAIFYITQAPPSRMNWLTKADAEQLGIEVSLFESKPTVASSPPAPEASQRAEQATPIGLEPLKLAPRPAPPSSSQMTLERRAAQFVTNLFAVWSSQNANAVAMLDALYGDYVRYFNKLLPRADVIQEKTEFVQRWPERRYTPRPDTLEIQCDKSSVTCDIKGTLDWDARSQVRGARSIGVAKFEFEITLAGRRPIVIAESSKVITRKVERSPPDSLPHNQ